MGHGAGRMTVMAVLAGPLIFAGGCHKNNMGAGTKPAEAARSAENPQASAEKVAAAGVAIVKACGKVSFANASKGLIVSETGLHEDVFDLRDRVSYRPVSFSLNEAQRLEALLQGETEKPGHTDYSAEQTACIGQFVDHFHALTEPLVQDDVEQRQLDVSAFDKASKDAEQETEQEEKALQSSSSPR